MTNKAENQLRAKRKDEHIKQFLCASASTSNGFEDVVLQHNSLPELNFDEVDTECCFLNKSISFPLMINAITGGTEYTKTINEALASISRQLNIPIAVGSQTIALSDAEAAESFKVVRDICKDGIVIANVNAASRLDAVYKAVDILNADAVQLHLNVPQEICMHEGDRAFKGILDNIGSIVSKTAVPVIVKETGFGMSYETARSLFDVGVRYIDISGRGGTNFIEIEDMRKSEKNCEFLYDWGIPTALSLLECRKAGEEMFVICSGGISRTEEIVKSLCMKANLTAMSGSILKILMKEGQDSTAEYLRRLIREARIMMLLLGVRNIKELRENPYLLKGETAELYRYKFNKQ